MTSMEIQSELDKILKRMELEKKLDETCVGIECIKTEISKLHNKFNCPQCGQKTLEPGDSYCSNCGNTVESWDELPGFIPYHKRK